MYLDNIGAILKNSIKDRGYTQEEFAEVTGIGLSSLKKYISGNVTYSIEALDIFSKFLHCSYDYLLGKTHSPEREIQDVKDLTRLSNGALESITYYAKTYDTDDYSKKYIDTLSSLVQSEFLVERFVNYFSLNTDEEFIWNETSPYPYRSVQVGDESLTIPEMEDAYLLGIVKALAEAKREFGSNVSNKYVNYKKLNTEKG